MNYDHFILISQKCLQMVRKPLGFSLFPTRDSAMPKTLINPVEIHYFEMLKMKETFWDSMFVITVHI